MKKVSANIRYQQIIKFLASGFYAGYSPIAPGTAGSLIGVLAYLLFQNLSHGAYISIVLGVTAAGIYVADKAEQIYGEKDSRHIVIDEIAGMLVTLIAIPSGMNFLIAGFLLFRIFDILKPFPICLADQKLKGGWGIMLDDILAGVYANLSLRVAGWIIGW